MARTTTIVTSVISGGKSAENVTVNTVTWSTDNGTITLSASVPSTVKIGDTVTDSIGNTYLITGISGNDLTCQDFDSTTDPATGSATIQESYQTIKSWAANLDTSTLYASSDDAIAECYSDAAFTAEGGLNISLGSSLNSIKVTVPSSERHDGTATSGMYIDGGDLTVSSSTGVNWEWVDHSMSGVTGMLCASTTLNMHQCIVRNGISTTNNLYGIRNSSGTLNIYNSIVYMIDKITSGFDYIYGINGATEVINTTCHNVDPDNLSTRTTVGINATTAKNCIAMDTAAGTASDFSVTTPSYNLSSDATASGTGSITNKSALNQFVSITEGSEDYHLKAGADALLAGDDLGATNSTDIDNFDRNSVTYGWDMGADQLETVRQTTVRTSIISGGKTAENADITAVSYNTNNGRLTLASVPSTVKIGDIITDSAGNSYLIYDISTTSSELFVQDFDSTTDPATGSTGVTIQEAYQTLGSWETDIDDIIPYESTDDATGEGYSDASFDESLTINSTSVETITLTVPEPERNDGTAGTGTRLIRTVNSSFKISVNTSKTKEVSWWEISGNGVQGTGVSNVVISADNVVSSLHHLIVHDYESTLDNAGIKTDYQGDQHNNIVYDIKRHGSNDVAYSCRGIWFRQNRVNNCYNNTVFNIENNNTYTGGIGGAYGITSANSNSTIKNCISVDSSANSGTNQDFSTTNATADYNLSSDTTASGANSLISKSSSDQFVSTVAGSEDLHLKSGADAIGAGIDLGTTPADVNLDIDNNDRDAAAWTWDMGADQWEPQRQTTVTTSLISGGKTVENVTIDGVMYRDNSGRLLLSATVPSTVNNGDTITDSSSNSYLITGISGSELYIQDFDSTTDPATGSATIQEAYQTIDSTGWQESLDDTILYRASDDAVGEGYSDAAFSEQVILDSGGTVGLNSVTLTAASGEGHDGTAGTGFRNDNNSNGVLVASVSPTPLYISKLELYDSNAGTSTYASPFDINAKYETILSRLLVHDFDGNASGGALSELECHISAATNETVSIVNSIIYDVRSRRTDGFGDSYGLRLLQAASTRFATAYNCTVYNIESDSSDAGANVIGIEGSANSVIKNCIAMDTSGGGGTTGDFSTPGTEEYNMASDTSVSGTGSLTSKSSSDQFVSTVAGSEDLHLKSGADAAGAGTDLGTTPTNVNIDIDGFDRHADTTYDPWDIGAHELQVTEVIVNMTSTANIISDWSADSLEFINLISSVNLISNWSADLLEFINLISSVNLFSDWSAEISYTVNMSSSSSVISDWSSDYVKLFNLSSSNLITSSWSADVIEIFNISSNVSLSSNWSADSLEYYNLESSVALLSEWSSDVTEIFELNSIFSIISDWDSSTTISVNLSSTINKVSQWNSSHLEIFNLSSNIQPFSDWQADHHETFMMSSAVQVVSDWQAEHHETFMMSSAVQIISNWQAEHHETFYISSAIQIDSDWRKTSYTRGEFLFEITVLPNTELSIKSEANIDFKVEI